MNETKTKTHEDFLFGIRWCLMMVARRYWSSKTWHGTLSDIDSKGDPSMHSQISRLFKRQELDRQNHAVKSSIPTIRLSPV